jgi:hypothetical protein
VFLPQLSEPAPKGRSLPTPHLRKLRNRHSVIIGTCNLPKLVYT